ncbi:FxLD family lantipeptide [Amycolatopsis marina]|uniref:Lantibiotic n=3 Tax=Pseudonocardiaceae TaxID=2070 RepID=A0A2V4APZ1_9PSEU|nr:MULTISPECIES: FxLD family lanthipeptide [Pseudonocardiaceae]MBE1579529.1 FxLD family lantipeptide [Amycolatopsis roodepoortensis]OLZ45563.1 lantibiotic precursor [Amycolatopsis keratiniphila subsp. nogabecina]PXY16816.1 lantibiotic precursor [Prauserella muralis]TWE14987.1 FxLD family lantipeptide [Prauserella muralis]SDU62857.1 FxLD family lantipeptide [Amycolatopsis keratiniphila]
MSEVLFSGGATALAERPVADDDEFALDVRVVVAYAPVMGDCPTDDGCGNTCAGNDSACNSFADDPS